MGKKEIIERRIIRYRSRHDDSSIIINFSDEIEPHYVRAFHSRILDTFMAVVHADCL